MKHGAYEFNSNARLMSLIQPSLRRFPHIGLYEAKQWHWANLNPYLFPTSPPSLPFNSAESTSAIAVKTTDH